MNKLLRSLLVVVAMAGAVALNGLAQAEENPAAAPQVSGRHEHQGPGHNERGHHLLARLAKKLGLSEQQKGQVAALFKTNRAQAQPLYAGLKTERGALRTLVHSGQADEAAIRAQSAKVAAIQADLAVQRAKGARQLQALLTPEQRTKMQALMAEREKKHHDKRRGCDFPEE
jgi:periplasmic protein CpxP/Spy